MPIRHRCILANRASASPSLSLRRVPGRLRNPAGIDLNRQMEGDGRYWLELPKNRSQATQFASRFILAIALPARVPGGSCPYRAIRSVNFGSSSGSRELFTRFDTGHRCNRSSAAGLSNSVRAAPDSHGS
jgi:hypothetical protein